MAKWFGHGRSVRRWALGAATLTTGLALLDAAFPDLVLLGVFVTGPLLCAVRSSPRETALVAAYAIALGVLAGVWNDIFFTRDHLTRLPGLTIGSLVAVWIAGVRQRGELVGTLGVVGVRVRERDPGRCRAGRAGDGVEVTRVGRARVDHPPRRYPGVGAAERHGRRIRRHEEIDPGRRVKRVFHRSEGH